jgi:hypothetical protein
MIPLHDVQPVRRELLSLCAVKNLVAGHERHTLDLFCLQGQWAIVHTAEGTAPYLGTFIFKKESEQTGEWYSADTQFFR